MFLSGAFDQTIKKIKAQTANVITLGNLSLGGFAIINTLKGDLKLFKCFNEPKAEFELNLSSFGLMDPIS